MATRKQGAKVGIIKTIFGNTEPQPGKDPQPIPEATLQAHEVTVSPANNTRAVRYLSRLARLYSLPVGHIGAAEEIADYKRKVESLGHVCPPDAARCGRLIKILGG